MKFLSYRHQGRTSFGAVAGDRIVDLGGGHPDLGAAIAAVGIDALRKAADGKPGTVALSEIEYLPVLPNPGRFVCAGYNYRSRASEQAPGEFPSLFLKHSSALIGHGAPMTKPSNSDSFDYEGEFCLVIGRRARHVAKADAYKHILGYTILNDGSVRDFQGHSVTAGKNFPHTSGFGPFLITADEIANPAALALTTKVNGEVRQSGNTRDLIFDIPFLVNYVSTFTELLPGDVISTGTPSGAGWRMDPPRWLKPGDAVEITIEGVGTLRNTVAAEA